MAILVGCGGAAPPTQNQPASQPKAAATTAPADESGDAEESDGDEEVDESESSDETATADGADDTVGADDPETETDEQPASSGDVELLEAVFAKELGENQDPIDPTEAFYPTDTVNISLRFQGRPKQGLISATFYFRDQEIASAEVDFADANSGVIFSIGEDTYAGFNLTTNEPLPISTNYSVVAMLDGVSLGTFSFEIVPPEDAIPSEITDVVLAEDIDEDYNPINPTTTFATDQEVILAVQGDVGINTWVQADWYIDGERDEEGTRSLTFEENAEATAFYFSYLPDGGWQEGMHEVALTMNDEEVGRYEFEIGEADAAVEEDSLEPIEDAEDAKTEEVDDTDLSEETELPITVGDITLLEATFAKELGENQEPVDPTEVFYPTDTVNISLQFAGRPSEGLVSAAFLFRDEVIAGTEIDFADTNSGVIFSVGKDTYAGFNLTVDQPLPISPYYSVVTMLNAEPLGTFPFEVVPPEDAIPSAITEVTLAEGLDEEYNPINPTTTFATNQEVYILLNGDVGISTWVQADWYVDGELDEEGTRSLTFEENAEDTAFFFSFIPDGGWSPGSHEVLITMNDEEIGWAEFEIE